MKVQNFKKFKYTDLCVKSYTTNDLNQRIYTLESAKSLVLEWNELPIEVNEHSLICRNMELIDTIRKYENNLVELLFKSSVELFGTQFPIEKFRDTLKTNVQLNIDGSEYLEFNTNNTKIINMTDSPPVFGTVYIKLDSLFFMQKEYYLDLNLMGVEYTPDYETYSIPENSDSEKPESEKNNEKEGNENDWNFF